MSAESATVLTMAARNGKATTDRRVRSDPRRLYLQVVEAILQLIDDEGLVPGSTLPGEPELARVFDVGRSTIREALAFLENEGLIERSQGARTTLTSLVRRPEMGLERLEPLEVLAERQGWECGTIGVTMTQARADEEQASRLRVAAGSEVTVVTRAKTLNGKPFAYMLSVVSDEIAPYAQLRREFTDSLTRLIGELFQLRYAEAEVTALACPAPIARALEIKRGAPVVELTELFFGDDARPLSWNVNYLVPGMLQLDILRRTSSGNPARDWVDARNAAPAQRRAARA